MRAIEPDQGSRYGERLHRRRLCNRFREPFARVGISRMEDEVDVFQSLDTAVIIDGVVAL